MINNNLVVILLLSSLLNIGITFYLHGTIEKHSVHPVYGTYQQKTFGCQPWDACKYPPDSLDRK